MDMLLQRLLTMKSKSDRKEVGREKQVQRIVGKPTVGARHRDTHFNTTNYPITSFKSSCRSKIVITLAGGGNTDQENRTVIRKKHRNSKGTVTSASNQCFSNRAQTPQACKQTLTFLPVQRCKFSSCSSRCLSAMPLNKSSRSSPVLLALGWVKREWCWDV